MAHGLAVSLINQAALKSEEHGQHVEALLLATKSYQVAVSHGQRVLWLEITQQLARMYVNAWNEAISTSCLIASETSENMDPPIEIETEGSYRSSMNQVAQALCLLAPVLSIADRHAELEQLLDLAAELANGGEG